MGATNNQGGPISVVQPPWAYQAVGASSSTLLASSNGGKQDYIENLVCVVATAATSQVQIKDGASSAITILPNNVAVGTYTIKLQARSNSGAWTVITGAGVSVLATGSFS